MLEISTLIKLRVTLSSISRVKHQLEKTVYSLLCSGQQFIDLNEGELPEH